MQFAEYSKHIHQIFAQKQLFRKGTVTTCVKTARKKFNELLPVLTILPPLLQDPWPCVSLQLLHAEHHARQTWPLTKKNLKRNDRAMIRQICSIKPEYVATVRSSKLLAKLELEDLNCILREKALLVWACGAF